MRRRTIWSRVKTIRSGVRTICSGAQTIRSGAQTIRSEAQTIRNGARGEMQSARGNILSNASCSVTAGAMNGIEQRTKWNVAKSMTKGAKNGAARKSNRNLIQNIKQDARRSKHKKPLMVTATMLMTVALVAALCGCSTLSGNVKIISAHGDGKEINERQAAEIAVSQVPGSTTDEVGKIREGTEEGFLIYKGKLQHDGITYLFKLDEASGNIVSWNVKL